MKRAAISILLILGAVYLAQKYVFPTPGGSAQAQQSQTQAAPQNFLASHCVVRRGTHRSDLSAYWNACDYYVAVEICLQYLAEGWRCERKVAGPEEIIEATFDSGFFSLFQQSVLIAACKVPVWPKFETLEFGGRYSCEP